jgi:photosystem II stability/assembly factor-like uncharacterized protein
MKKYYPIRIAAFLSLIIFTSLQTQAQWQEQTSPTTNPLYSVSVVDNSVAWIGGQSGTVLRTTDGGANWTSVGGAAIGNNVYNIFGVDDQTALCAATNISPFGYGYVFKTTDGGVTWDQVFIKIGSRLHAIWMFNSTNGFMYGSPVNSGWELYNTTDGGTTWIPAPNLFENGTEFGHHNAMFVSGTDIYFGTANSRIYYSNNMGNLWTPQTTTQTNTYSIWFNDASNGLTGGESSLNRTTDGGTTWNLLTTLPGSGEIDAITGVNSKWWTARQAAIYNSVDNAASWSTQYTSPTFGVYNAMTKARNDNLILAVRSDGGISANIITLPVELTSFTATSNAGQVILNWQTATEINNSGFEVERKVGSAISIWEKVGFVDGNGTTAETKAYSFTDNNVSAGNYLYRLKQIDYNGTFEYSNVIVAEVDFALKEFVLNQNYPNPFNPSTVISFQLAAGSQVTLRIFNVIGEEVATLVNEKLEEGIYNYEFEAAELNSGIYFYTIDVIEANGSKYSSTKKMMVIK